MTSRLKALALIRDLTRRQSELEESENIAMLKNMNAAQVIEEIDALPAGEQSKVIAHLHQVQEERFHEEQVRIAEKRLEDLDNGLTGTVSHEEAMRMIREA